MGKSTSTPTHVPYFFVWSGEQSKAAGCSLHPEHKQKPLDGISCHLLSQLSTHKAREFASLKTKDKTQNVKQATIFTCSEIAIILTATLSGKVLLGSHRRVSKCHQWDLLCFAFTGPGNPKRKRAQFSRTKLTHVSVFLGTGSQRAAF